MDENNQANQQGFESKLKSLHDLNNDLQRRVDSLKHANLELNDKCANFLQQIKEGAGQSAPLGDEAQKMMETIEKLVKEKSTL